MSSLNPNLEGDYSHIDGTGQTIVVIDSGIDTDHPFFGSDNDGDGVSDRIIFSKTFGTGTKHGDDVGGHGTHVAGIIASSDVNYTGLAPGCNIIALKVFDSHGATVEDANVHVMNKFSLGRAIDKEFER